MESNIRAVVEETLARAKNIFGVHDVSFEIIEDPSQAIPETGVGGYAPDSYTITIYYDSSNENFKINWQGEIKSSVMHEFHHAVRNRTYNWKEDSLLGAIVTEGLADHFDIEMNGGKPKPWSVALSDEDFERIAKLASAEFHSYKYNHTDWFFGSESRNIPKWAGYSLGFKLVGDYLKKTHKKASELVAEPAESFLD